MSTTFPGYHGPHSPGINVNKSEHIYQDGFAQHQQPHFPTHLPVHLVPSAPSLSSATGFSHHVLAEPNEHPVYVDSRLLAGGMSPLQDPFGEINFDSVLEPSLMIMKGHRSNQTQAQLIYDDEDASHSASSSASTFYDPQNNILQTPPTSIPPLAPTTTSLDELYHKPLQIDSEQVGPVASLPTLEDTEPLFVNVKQYHRILKRRKARARLAELHRLSNQRKVKRRGLRG
ncbi:MAG: hypothetical protein CYPHOPRED_001742 [Cyphobasidiales sp. Tagirdzhanova-0007]|nr:MAG: hypothetical protein CYPHOPRED_001742 [Cyphobasidiales sp. Tagirdzhanova-0007]